MAKAGDGGSKLDLEGGAGETKSSETMPEDEALGVVVASGCEAVVGVGLHFREVTAGPRQRRRLSVIKGHVRPVAVAVPFAPLGGRATLRERQLHMRLSTAYRRDGCDAQCPEGHQLAVGSMSKPKACVACGRRLVGAYVTCSQGSFRACEKCAGGALDESKYVD